MRSAGSGASTFAPCDINMSYSGICQYQELFGDRCYLLGALHWGDKDGEVLQGWRRLSEQTGVPLVAAGDVHYHIPQRQVMHEVLTAIRYGTTVAELRERRFSNAERYLRPRELLAQIYTAAPEMLSRSVMATRDTFGNCRTIVRATSP